MPIDSGESLDSETNCDLQECTGASSDALAYYWQDIAFTVFDDDIGDRGQFPTRRVFKTAKSYQRYFGHDAPNVDFAKERVIFFSAGVKSTGGYEASISEVQYNYANGDLVVRTLLEKPGPSCLVTQAFTKPFVLAKVQMPTTPKPRFTRFESRQETYSCSE